MSLAELSAPVAAASALDVTLGALGGLLVLGAFLSGLARRSFLSLTSIFVLSGFLLGEGGLGILDFDARGPGVEALLVLAQGIPAGERLFNLAALTVFCSIIVHGLTDTPGSEWLARRAAARDGGEAPAAAPPSG